MARFEESGGPPEGLNLGEDSSAFEMEVNSDVLISSDDARTLSWLNNSIEQYSDTLEIRKRRNEKSQEIESRIMKVVCLEFIVLCAMLYGNMTANSVTVTS